MRVVLGAQPGKSRRGPRPGWRAVPAISVVAGSLLSVLPIMSANGWWPNMGLLMLIGWRLLRADAIPAWGAAPLGFVDDIVTGGPVGLSVALWTAIMLVMEPIDRRTMWRDYRVEWLIAILLLSLAEVAQWRAAALAGAPVTLARAWPSIVFSALAYPIAGFLAARLDRWRLGW